MLLYEVRVYLKLFGVMSNFRIIFKVVSKIFKPMVTIDSNQNFKGNDRLLFGMIFGVLAFCPNYFEYSICNGC